MEDFYNESAKCLAGTSKIDNPLTPINTYKFGEYFMKCTGRLNSTLRIGEGSPHDRPFLPVVRHTIGYRQNRGFQTNSHYADRHLAYSILHPEHIELVCKQKRRNAIRDFWNLKSDFIVRFHNMKVAAMQFVDPIISVGDVIVLGEKKPTNSKYAYKDVGYILNNSRSISRDNVSISIREYTDAFGSYEDRMSSIHMKASKRSFQEMGRLDITGQISENDNRINMFRLSIEGNTYPSLELYDTKFDGIDFKGLIAYISNEYSKFNDDFNAGLDSLRDKYLAEYVLSEICDSNTAI